MTNNRRGVTVECTACAWQGDESLTDARYCPDCGGECVDLAAIYGDAESSPEDETPNLQCPQQQ